LFGISAVCRIMNWTSSELKPGVWFLESETEDGYTSGHIIDYCPFCGIRLSPIAEPVTKE